MVEFRDKYDIIEEPNGIWKGVLKSDDGQIIWRCGHNHSKPKLNVRWDFSKSRPWERSAKSCAEIAYGQLASKVGQDEDEDTLSFIVGSWGEINQDHVLDKRQDTKIIKVTGHKVVGFICLTDSGDRVLVVDIPDWSAVGMYSFRTERVYMPEDLPLQSKELQVWLTALNHFKSDVWGTVFRHARDRPDLAVQQQSLSLFPYRSVGDYENTPSLYKEFILKQQKYVPNSSADQAQSDDQEDDLEDDPELQELDDDLIAPFLRVADDDHQRVYEIVGMDGGVAGRYVHRGKAVQRLHKEKKKYERA